jgi:hypothetical protein
VLVDATVVNYIFLHICRGYMNCNFTIKNNVAKDTKYDDVSCDLTTRERTQKSKSFILLDILHFPFKSFKFKHYPQKFRDQRPKPYLGKGATFGRHTQYKANYNYGDKNLYFKASIKGIDIAVEYRYDII